MSEYEVFNQPPSESDEDLQSLRSELAATRKALSAAKNQIENLRKEQAAWMLKQQHLRSASRQKKSGWHWHWKSSPPSRSRMLNKSTYLLICLIEECAEIIQRVCKAIRFGLDEIQPGQSLNNLDRIGGEVDDFLGVVQMLDNENLRVFRQDRIAIQNKIDKVQSFMSLSRERGMLEKEHET